MCRDGSRGHTALILACTDRDRQRQTETDRDRQRQTETDRAVSSRTSVSSGWVPLCGNGDSEPPLTEVAAVQ